jgi:hypothetical protein
MDNLLHHTRDQSVRAIVGCKSSRHRLYIIWTLVITGLLTFTFRLLHCTQPERVFLCALRGATCIILDCEAHSYVTIRDLSTHVGRLRNCQTPSAARLQPFMAIRVRMREAVGARCRRSTARLSHMTRARQNTPVLTKIG